MGVQVPTFKDLINETLVIYKTRLVPFIKIYLASILIGIFFLISLGFVFLLIALLSAAKLPSLVFIPVSVLIGLVVLAFNVTLLASSGIASTYAISDEPFEGVKETFKRAWAKAGPYLIAEVIFGVIAVLGYIALIIPGIIVSLTFFLAPYLVIFENFGVKAALKESETRTFGIKTKLLILSLQFIGVMILLQLPFTILSKMLEDTGFALIVDLASLVVSIALTPAQIIIPYLLYKHLKPVEQVAQIPEAQAPVIPVV